MTELHDDSSKLTRIIEDLQQICKNTTDETQKLVILDKILTAWYEVKSRKCTHVCKRQEIIWWEGDDRQNQ